MKKRILTMLALCATIMCLAACDNEETNTNATGGTTTATVTATPAAKEEADTSSTETENNTATTVEPTTAPTADTTVEATVTPTEAPAVTEVSWEESGMSYELFENPVDKFGRKTVAVIITNNSDTTYSCNYSGFRLEPNGKWYKVFFNTDEAEEFINNLENTSKCKSVSTNVLTTELECTVTNVTNQDNYNSIEIKSNDIIKAFNTYNNLNVTYDEFWNAIDSFNMDLIDTYGSTGTCILYNSNNEIVTIESVSLNINFNENTEAPDYTFGVSIPSDLEYSKVTMVMQYAWNDGIFE